MKIRIKGDYVKDGFIEFEPCEVIIEFGKVQLIKPKNKQVFDGPQPSYNSKFRVEKIFYEKYRKDLKYTHQILYQNENQETEAINIKPNTIQIFRLKWAFSQYLILSKDVKTSIIKYVITGVLSFFGGIFVGTIYQQSNVDKKNTDEIENLDNQKTKPKRINLKSTTDSTKNDIKIDCLK